MEKKKHIVCDDEILKLFHTDKKNAFKLLYECYYLRLTVYVGQLADSFELAEDLVQDFFVIFWEKRLWNHIDGSLQNYLFRAVRNNALTALRRLNLQSIEELSAIPCVFPDEEYDAVELAARCQKLMDEFEKLPPQELKIVRKVIMENKKYKEAAEELQISVNTLKTHLARALNKLKKNNNLMLFFY